MPNLVTSLLRWSHWAVRAALVVLALGVVGLGGGIAVLTQHPLSLQRALPYVQQYIEPYGLSVAVDEIVLGFKQRFYIEAKGIALKGPQGHVRLKVEHVEASFANRRLARGQLALKHVSLNGAVAHIQVQEDKVFLGAKELVSLQTEETPTLDVVAFLNTIHTHKLLREMRTLTLTESHFLIRDRQNHVTWLAQDTQASLTHYPEEGEKLSITSNMRQKQVPTPMPVFFTAEHTKGSQWLSASLRFEDSNTDFVKAYIPPSMQEMLKSRGQIELGTRMGLKNKIEAPYFVLRLDETELFPEHAYTHPLKFKSVILRGRYAQAPEDTLSIEELTLTDPHDNTIRVEGHVRGLEEDPQLDIRLKSDVETLDKVLFYLPDKAMKATSEWLHKAMDDVQIGDVSATYKGQPSQMPFCQKECGIAVQANILDGRVTFLKDAEPAQDVSATLTLKENWLNVTAEHAQWAGQAARDVSVTLVGLFTEGGNVLHVAGHSTGPLKPLLAQLSKGLKEDGIPTASGEVSGTFYIELPIHKGQRDAHISEIKMDIKTQIERLAFPVEPLGDIPLYADQATVTLKDSALQFKSKGLFKNVPVQVDWQSDLISPKTTPRLNVRANVPMTVLAPYVKSGVENLGGSVAIVADVLRKNAKTYTVHAVGNAMHTRFNIPDLNWQKKMNMPLDAEVDGQIQLKGADSVINIDHLSAVGAGVEVAGSVYLDEDKNLSVQLSPFKVGAQDLAVQVTPDAVELVGQQLDARAIDLLSTKETTTLPENIDIRLAIEKVLLEHGDITYLKVNSTRKEGHWEKAELEGLAADKPFGLSLTPTPNGGQELFMGMQNTGAVLKRFVNFKQIQDGALQGRLTTHRNAQGEKVGTGVVTIRQARLVDVPIMAQLLALLSLEPLMDSSSGIGFSTITIPLSLQPDGIHISAAEFQGPSMDMQIKGFYSNDGQLNLDGRLIPAVGLNRTLAHLPVLGTLLAGSQDGVLVADFKIKGLAEDPKVSVKPLSLVTPGLVKDIWGGLFNNDVD